MKEFCIATTFGVYLAVVVCGSVHSSENRVHIDSSTYQRIARETSNVLGCSLPEYGQKHAESFGVAQKSTIDIPFVGKLFSLTDTLLSYSLTSSLRQSVLQRSGLESPATLSALAVIDTVSWKICAVELVNAAFDSSNTRPLGLEAAEHKITERGEEYVSVPETTATDLIAALLACIRSPFKATRTTAQLVNWRSPWGEERPVWIISSVGIDPPLEPYGIHGGDVPVYQRNRVRQFIDTRTGKIIHYTSSPSVPLDEERRQQLRQAIEEHNKRMKEKHE